MPELNVFQIRNQFPFLRRRVALPDGTSRAPVFLNAAATSQVSTGVLKTVNAMAKYYGPVGRGNGTIQKEATALYRVLCRKALDLVKADPAHFDTDFTGPNATMALNILICGLDLKAEDRVIHTVYDHNSLRNPLYEFHPDQRKITMVGLSQREWPALDLKQLRAEIKKAGKKLRLVALTHASNLTGDILPIGI